MARPTDYLNANGGIPSSENGDGADDDGGVKIGARQRKDDIAFLPEGEEVTAIPYASLAFHTTERDWSRISLLFMSHHVVIEGRNLRGLLRQIMARVVDWVEVTDPLQAAAGQVKFEVTAIRVEMRES